MRVPQEFLDLAHELADAAGCVLMRYWRTGVEAEIKPDDSPVSRADRESEALIRERIEARCPGHGILGEEYGMARGDAEWLWVVDPLDGTKSFLKGKPTFGILIGLVHEGRHVAGVMDFPAVGDRWAGADGHGTRLNGETVRTRPCPTLADAVTASVGPDAACEDDIPLYAALRRAVRWQMFGLEAMAYGLIASGRIDLAVDGNLDRHDIAAFEPVVRNAGGVLSGPAGEPVTPDYRGRVVAAGDPALLRAALAAMRGAGA